MTTKVSKKQSSERVQEADMDLEIQRCYPFEYDIRNEIVETEDGRKIFIGGIQISCWEQESHEFLSHVK